GGGGHFEDVAVLLVDAAIGLRHVLLARQPTAPRRHPARAVADRAGERTELLLDDESRRIEHQRRGTAGERHQTASQRVVSRAAGAAGILVGHQLVVAHQRPLTAPEVEAAHPIGPIGNRAAVAHRVAERGEHAVSEPGRQIDQAVGVGQQRSVSRRRAAAGESRTHAAAGSERCKGASGRMQESAAVGNHRHLLAAVMSRPRPPMRRIVDAFMSAVLELCREGKAITSRGVRWMALAVALGCAAPLTAQEEPAPVLAAQTPGSAEERAASMVVLMTLDEKLTLLKGYFGTDFPPADYEAPADARYGSAGYVPGIPRLGIPPQWQADAGIGVATQGGSPVKRPRTALPSGLALAATWDLDQAYAGGAMIGSEARAGGVHALLGGSVNLIREPRNGRNFEYAGEDPWLAGAIVGAQIAGVQSNRIVSTAKHYAVNAQETDRGTGNSVVEEGALRMADLLAFEVAIERGNPASVMCAYNRVNGPHSCEHPFLLTQVLREEWGFKGYVMSDWGAVHSTAPSANAGLDQESGFGLQRADWFNADKLRAALAAGEIAAERIDLMAGR